MLKSCFLSKLIIFAIFFACVLPSFADLDFRNHRYSSFQVLPGNKEGDIVFIGNSITNMMNWNELFGDNPKIKNRGTSGGYTQEILDNLESMISGNPSKIFLMIGTNDLGTQGTNYSVEAVAYRIEKILSRVRKEAPGADVYFQSILPSQVGIRTEAKTQETNSLVEAWIKKQNDPKLSYIDIFSSLNDNGNLINTSATSSEDSNSYDGLHLTQKGYKIWADIIKDYVGAEPSIPDEAVNLWGNLSGSNGMRVTYFGAFPVKNTDILLIGDEMIHSGEWNELLNSADFKDRGIGWGFPGISLDNVDSIIEPILEGNKGNGVTKETPRAVLLYAGMSNLIKGENVEDIIAKYENIISKLQSYKKDLPVFIMTLVPAGNYDNNLDAKITILNDKITAFADSKKNINVIDIYEALKGKDSNREELFFCGTDSPYLSGPGYAIVANEIANGINNTLGTNYKSLSYEEANENLANFNNATVKQNGTFIVFDNANSEVPYRIPAIAKNKSGDLIAVADYRYSKADIGVVENGKLDLRFRIKDEETGEWSDVKTLAAAIGEGDNNIAFGDPCIVADRESDFILVTSCSGNVSFPKGTHENHQGWARFYSHDGGKTWSEYEEMGDQLLNILDQRSDGPVNAFFIGSGKIEQSSKIKVGDYYRIYCSALVRVNNGSAKVNYVVYSDDFGKTWNLLGDIEDCPIPYGADEPKAQELPDGSVLVSSRIAGGRFYNIFHYDDMVKGTGKWEDMATSDSRVNGIIASSNACNGETLVVPVIRNTDGESTYLLLQSVPMSSTGGRANVGINYKELESLDSFYFPYALACDWDGAYEVTPLTSAYSTMTLDKDNDLAFFYEENIYNGGYDMVYKKLSIEDVTAGKYSFKEMTGNESLQYLLNAAKQFMDNINFYEGDTVGYITQNGIEELKKAYSNLEVDPSWDSFKTFLQTLNNAKI